MTTLVLASGNPGKLREMQQYLAPLNWELRLKPEELEVEETGETFAENACLKASEVARMTGQWAIADDSGLAVNALGGAPGVYSARYGKTDLERIERLLAELQGKTDRQAQFVCVIALSRPDGTIAAQTEGICKGKILNSPRGEGGFGYDPVFYVPDYEMTFAEMPLTLKQTISHRGKALASLVPIMTDLGG